jgi:hypothetical protein
MTMTEGNTRYLRQEEIQDVIAHLDTDVPSNDTKDLMRFLVQINDLLNKHFTEGSIPGYPYIDLAALPTWQETITLDANTQVRICTQCGRVMASTNGTAPETFSGTHGSSLCLTCVAQHSVPPKPTL